MLQKVEPLSRSGVTGLKLCGSKQMAGHGRSLISLQTFYSRKNFLNSFNVRSQPRGYTRFKRLETFSSNMTFFCLEPKAGWKVLNYMYCEGHDLHRIEFMKPASNINECIAQCYGFLNFAFEFFPNFMTKY